MELVHASRWNVLPPISMGMVEAVKMSEKVVHRDERASYSSIVAANWTLELQHCKRTVAFVTSGPADQHSTALLHTVFACLRVQEV